MYDDSTIAVQCNDVYIEIRRVVRSVPWKAAEYGRGSRILERSNWMP